MANTKLSAPAPMVTGSAACCDVPSCGVVSTPSGDEIGAMVTAATFGSEEKARM